MGNCFGCGVDEEAEKKEGVVVQRGCRDVLCLLLFIAFWAGMFVICGIAFNEGETNRLVYGVDSFGFTCGSKNTIFNKTFDLREAKNMYYLNPLALLSGGDLDYAKSICSTGCPGSANMCSRDNFPCTRDDQYICPYYRFAEDGLYGYVPGVSDEDTSYWAALAGMTAMPNGTSVSTKLLSKAKSLGGYFKEVATELENNLTGKYFQLQSQFPGNGPCYPVLVETHEFFYRCFPKFPSNMTDALEKVVSGAYEKIVDSDTVQSFVDEWNSSSQKWARYVGDISRGILVIVIGGLVGGLVLSLLWLVILRFLGGVVVWLIVLVVNLFAIGCCLYCWVLAGYIGSSGVGETILDQLPVDINPAKNEEKTWFWIAIGSSVVAGVLLLVTLLCFSRIKIAVACIKVASQAVGAMPMIIFFPVLPFIFEVGLVIYWVAVTGMLYSAGDLTAHCRDDPPSTQYSYADMGDVSNMGLSLNSTSSTSNTTFATCYSNLTTDARAFACGTDPDCYLSYDWNNKLKYAFIYHFFGLLWTNQVIVGFSCVTIAGAIGHYYWAGGDSARMPMFPILTSLKNTVVFSMGSICFGALIIAIIQFIRFLLEYLDRKTKEIQAQNKCAEWAMCCIKCCMWCLEKIVKFINRNAYVMIGIKGYNYCCAAIKAVKLIVSNALRMAVVNLVADLLIFMGKVSVAGCAGLVAFLMTEADYYNNPTKYPDTYLYSPVLPIGLSVIIGFIVAEIFFAVYEMAIDTVLLAFCEDCEKNGGNPKYAPPLLMEAMGQAAGDAAVKPNKA